MYGSPWSLDAEHETSNVRIAAKVAGDCLFSVLSPLVHVLGTTQVEHLLKVDPHIYRQQ